LDKYGIIMSTFLFFFNIFMKNYDNVGQRLGDLKFWRLTGKKLPEMRECVNDGVVDYDMLEALILLQPALAREFRTVYDRKNKQIVYNIVIPEMENDLRKDNLSLRALRIICFALSAKHFQTFCHGLENPFTQRYMRKYYGRYCAARKATC